MDATQDNTTTTGTQEVSIRTEFAIPAENQAGFLASVAKLQKVAAKVGVPPVVVTFLREEIRQIPDRQALDALASEGIYDVSAESVPYITVKYLHYRLEGEAPKFSGWTFLAAVEPTPHGNLIRKVPGMEIGSLWQKKEMTCEHCNVARKRKAYYIVRHDDGSEKSVGAQCLKDFLGHANPARIGSWFEMFHALEGHENCGGARQEFFAVEEVLSVALACIRRDGFVSRKMVQEREERAARDDSVRIGKATSEDVHFYYERPYSREQTEALRQHRIKYAPNEGDKDLAKAVVQWMLDLEQKPTLSDFEHNLVVHAKTGHVTGREFGLLTAAANSGARALNRFNTAEKVKKSNEWVGEEGARIEMRLTLVDTRHFDGHYNTTVLVSFEDELGNSVKWFSSRDQGFKKGAVYNVRGTVKKHDTYKDRKQTMLTRCKLAEVVVEGAKEG